MNPNSALQERIEIELNPRQRRAYDALRERVVGAPASGRSGLWQYVLLLPDLVVLLIRLTRDSRVPLGSKMIALIAVGYVLSPIDLIPEFLGPVGLLDDLLVVLAAVSHFLNSSHPDLVRQHWSGSDEILESIRRFSDWAETAVSKRFSGRLKGWTFF